MKKLCPKCNCEWEGYHDESASNHRCVIRLKGAYKAMSCLNQPTTAEIEVSVKELTDQLMIQGYICKNCLSDIEIKYSGR